MSVRTLPPTCSTPCHYPSGRGALLSQLSMSHRLRKLFTGSSIYSLGWVRVRRRCVPSRFPFASSTHLETKVIQEEYRCFNYRRSIQRRGRNSVFLSSNRHHSVNDGNKQTIQILTTLAFCVKRRISVVRKLHRLSRERGALRKANVPKVRVGECSGFHHRGRLTIAQHVHEYLTQEYSRTCLISFESLPEYEVGVGQVRRSYPLRFKATRALKLEVGSFFSTGHTCFVPQALDGMGSAFDGFCSILYQILVRPSHL